MKNNRNSASGFLSGYFAQVYSAAGLRWVGDNAADMDDLVDAIIDAATDDVVKKILDVEGLQKQLFEARTEVAFLHGKTYADYYQPDKEAQQ